MSRPILDKTNIHPAIQQLIGGDADFRNTVEEVATAAKQSPLLIVGMKQNPFPKKARQLLDKHSIDYQYLEYGSYFSQWKRRGAIKMWAGWQTFPMVFVNSQLIGGFQELQTMVESGDIAKSH